MKPIILRKRTKREKAVELYEQNHHLPYEKVVHTFIKELNLPSENSARTYISLSKKALAVKLQLPYSSRKVDARKTKRGRAMDIFIKNPHLTRKEMIDKFVEELNMTWNSAATHCSMCVQEYVGPKHKTIV
jgi:hypothetical protein